VGHGDERFRQRRQRRGGAISASRGAAVPSRHRCDSWPSDEVVGSFFVDFEAIRTEPRRSAQAALKKEMELYALENEAALSEVIEDLSDDEGYASSVLSDDSQEDLIPETLAPPLDESPEEARDRVKKERLDRRKYRHRRRREKAQRELRKRRERHEAEQAAVLEAFRKDALIAHAKAELEWMELEEEARVIEKQAFRARANLRKVALYCQGKGMDELRARYDLGVPFLWRLHAVDATRVHQTILRPFGPRRGVAAMASTRCLAASASS
jgi:hypothetical protein